MSLQLWLAFVAANLAISVSPGPGALAVVNASIAGGLRAGWQVVVGLQLALLTHLAIVAVGLGALLVASPGAFEILCWIGAAYLAWLGVSELASALRRADEAVGREAPRGSLLLHGLLVNLTNPKSIVFSLAFIPQFIVQDRSLPLQYTIIGVTMVALDSVVMSGYGLLAARLRAWLENPFWARIRRAIFGLIFLILGVGLLFTRQG